METRGKVTAINNKIITIEVADQEICTDCGIKSDSQFALGCKSCGLLKNKDAKYVKAINRFDLPLKKGDVVKVSLSPFKAVKAGFFIFIVPLFLFFLCYFLAEQLFLVDTELIKVGAGLAGIITGYVFVFLRSRVLKHKDWPQVISISDI
ncbi:MAG: SoxR reducing system RseC family protein [Spirochaetales bacterium]|nr:SoxR reducing system RseC family protein [Spirochaetales bacterium]